MESEKPPNGLPHARGTSLRGVKEAAQELWGSHAIREIARGMPADAREAVIDNVVMPSAWVPEAHVIALCRAVWEGPVRRDEGMFSKYMARVSFHAFGRFQKILLSVATPEKLAMRTPTLWSREHTHGALTVELTTSGQIIRLSGGPYVETEFARAALAESFRHVMDLTRVQIRRSRHVLETRQTLAIHQTWR